MKKYKELYNKFKQVRDYPNYNNRKLRFFDKRYYIVFISAIKITYQEWKFMHERCAYCGWYLHPQRLFDNVSAPMKMVYWQEDDGRFVCSKCHYLNRELNKMKK